MFSTPDSNSYELRTNASLPPTFDSYINRQNPLDEYGVCDRWYFNGKDAFSLKGGLNVDNKKFALMETIFSKGWTTGELLFDGALSCWIGVTVNDGSAQPSINTTTQQPICVFNVYVSMYTQPIICVRPGPSCPQSTYQKGTSCFWEGLGNDGCGSDSFVY